jgi:DNA (cytosine-5)-methyltransferase 1
VDTTAGLLPPLREDQPSRAGRKRPDRQRGRYRAQYIWRCATVRCHAEVYPGVLPAAAAIDWALPAERIGDRARPLAAKTIARIEAGLKRYARPPFLTPLRSGRPRTMQVSEPFATVVADGGNHGLVDSCPPFLTIHRGGPDELRTASVDAPAPTLTASGNHLGTVVPPMLVPAGGTWNDGAASVAEPFRTRTTRDTEALVVPVEGRDNVAARGTDEPLRTQTARLQDALVVPLRGTNTAKAADSDPLDTVAAAGNHHALVMRNNTTARGDAGQMSTPVDEPVRTITTTGHQSLIRWDHLLVPYDRTGVARPVAEPMATQTTVQGEALVGPQIAVDDCTFRMLEPHEIQAAMAFLPGYTVLGNKRERVRQLGNAVTPPAARDLIAALVEAITGDMIEVTA